MNTAGCKKSWYKEWFGSEYLTVYDHRDSSDARQLLQLISQNIPLNGPARVLDVACGNGRHSRELADLDLRVIGTDLSMTLLSHAAEMVRHRKFPKFVRADMRWLPFKIKFNLLLSLFTSFGYFDSDEENAAVLHEYASVLHEGGWLVFDYLNAEYVQRNLISDSERKVNEHFIKEQRWISGGRVNKKIIIHSAHHTKEFIESVRMFDRFKLQEMLQRSGFDIVHVFGHYDGSAPAENKPRLIFFAKKQHKTGTGK